MENIDIGEIYHFLFETIPGIGVMVGAGLIISIICCFIFEIKTRKRFRNYEAEQDDEWAFLDDENENDDEETGKEG
ncbi:MULTISPECIES: DUF6724 family protein [unclassified Adlercreutzia]|uniref:DUF6724 family protein n=1 Tax=unclassified Adlercreutzia TaxID=2636013 RepID=UPI001F14BDE0|nr:MULTISPECIES: DUF6724 family protein [unclassified Adlercreutzia]